MKPDFSRQGTGKRAYRRKANGVCCLCKVSPAIEGQGHCDECHALYQRFWRVKNKAKSRTFDDDVKMVALGLALVQRRLGLAPGQRKVAA